MQRAAEVRTRSLRVTITDARRVMSRCKGKPITHKEQRNESLGRAEASDMMKRTRMGKCTGGYTQTHYEGNVSEASASAGI
jgi:hypothetical protein